MNEKLSRTYEELKAKYGTEAADTIMECCRMEVLTRMADFNAEIRGALTPITEYIDTIRECLEDLPARKKKGLYARLDSMSNTVDVVTRYADSVFASSVSVFDGVMSGSHKK